MKMLLLIGAALLFLTDSGKAQNSISGYIVSLETAKPIENATIFLNDKYGLPLNDSLRVTSDSAGFYKIDGIKTGRYIINAWTTYQAMHQQYAMVIQSKIIKIDSSMTADFVFSENAFKFSLHLHFHSWQALTKSKKNSDLVAWRAVRPQLYINSRKVEVGARFIQKIKDIKK